MAQRHWSGFPLWADARAPSVASAFRKTPNLQIRADAFAGRLSQGMTNTCRVPLSYGVALVSSMTAAPTGKATDASTGSLRASVLIQAVMLRFAMGARLPPQAHIHTMRIEAAQLDRDEFRRDHAGFQSVLDSAIQHRKCHLHSGCQPKTAQSVQRRHGILRAQFNRYLFRLVFGIRKERRSLSLVECNSVAHDTRLRSVKFFSYSQGEHVRVSKCETKSSLKG